MKKLKKFFKNNIDNIVNMIGIIPLLMLFIYMIYLFFTEWLQEDVIPLIGRIDFFSFFAGVFITIVIQSWIETRKENKRKGEKYK